MAKRKSIKPAARGRAAHGPGGKDGAVRAPGKPYVLRLYITGTTPRSARAIETIKRLCEDHLEGEYDLRVIDLYQQPSLAAAAQILAAPTLVKQLPAPVRRFVGDMTDEQRVRNGLGIGGKQ